MPEAAAETSLAPQAEPIDAEQALHLLRRTQWTSSPEARAIVQTSGLAAQLDQLLDPNRRDLDAETAALARIAYPDSPTPGELAEWWLYLMVNTHEPFREVMALFWHDHFATSVVAFERPSRRLLREQIQKLRILGTGDVRQLLYAMLTDPAMLIWLNGVDNTRDQVNENLAREFYERFALGVDNGYTQADIHETARALTGYKVVHDTATDLDRVVFDPARADAGPKTVFGRTGNFGFREIVDLVLAERPVAEFVCRRLFEHFCYANAPNEVIAQLAAMLRASDYQLQPVLRTILRSRAFFAGKSRGSHVKSPVEAGVSLLRSTGLHLSLSVADFLLASQGQRLFAPPDVGGWPKDEDWLGAANLILRMQFAHALATNRADQEVRGVRFESLLPPVAQRTAAAVVTALADRLGLQLTQAELDAYRDYLDTRAFEEQGELRTEPDPFRGGDPTHLSERARGLLFMLTQHPSYQLR